MKSLYNYLLIFIFTFLLEGCVDETAGTVVSGNGSEVEVSLHVSVPVDNRPVTRQAQVYSSANVQENLIRKIDVLAFRVNPDDSEYFDYYSEGKLISGEGTTKQTFRAAMRIKDYKQRFVVIVNAHDEVMKLIGSVEWRKAPKDEMLKMLEFVNKASDHKWDASSSPSFTPFPMWGEMSAAELISSSTTSVDGIHLLRMVAKIDITVAENDAVSGQKTREHFRLTEVYLYNVKDNGCVVPDRNTLIFPTPDNLIVDKPTIPSSLINWAGPLKYITDDETSLMGQIYTLEAKATDLSKNRQGATGLVIGGYYSKDGITWNNTPSYYRLDIMTTDKSATRDILRNYNYQVRIVQVNGPGKLTPETAWLSSVPMELMVAQWNIQSVSGDMGKRQLNTSASRVSIIGMSSSRIYFWTDQPSVKVEDKGYVGTSGNIPFNVNEFFDDLAGGFNTSMFHFNPQTGEGFMDIATLSVNEVDNDVRRIYLNAGGLRREIIINSQIRYKPQPFNIFPWIGTFHRSHEVGERIIYSDHVGEWSAEVDEPTKKGSFVTLSKVPSDNKNIGTDSPGNPEDYPVYNGKPEVFGKGRIYFRVGMKSKYTPTLNTPARYATITVKYNGGVAKIYVRQGEDADFLMRNGDKPMGTSDITVMNRTLSRKFSPYNLTDAKGRPGRVGDVLGSKYSFTDYPTQSGYYFQWGKTYAWYPDGLHPIDWEGEDVLNLWESNKDAYESCPPGYHRPSDGSTASFVTLPRARDSEIRQSLYLNPRDANNSPPNNDNSIWGKEDSDNSIWGYYADGFFDRRTPRESLNGEKATMVGSGAELAYIGRLFYNPYTSASVFFPASGVRDNNNVVYGTKNGLIVYSGIRAYFWTSTKFNQGNGLYQSAAPHRSIIVETGNLRAFPIRCMKDQ